MQRVDPPALRCSEQPRLALATTSRVTCAIAPSLRSHTTPARSGLEDREGAAGTTAQSVVTELDELGDKRRQHGARREVDPLNVAEGGKGCWTATRSASGAAFGSRSRWQASHSWMSKPHAENSRASAVPRSSPYSFVAAPTVRRVDEHGGGRPGVRRWCARPVARHRRAGQRGRAAPHRRARRHQSAGPRRQREHPLTRAVYLTLPGVHHAAREQHHVVTGGDERRLAHREAGSPRRRRRDPGALRESERHTARPQPRGMLEGHEREALPAGRAASTSASSTAAAWSDTRPRRSSRPPR